MDRDDAIDWYVVARAAQAENERLRAILTKTEKELMDGNYAGARAIVLMALTSHKGTAT